MPGKFPIHTPDAIDVNTMVTALGQDFGLVTRWTVTCERDVLTVICRTYHVKDYPDGVPAWQSLQHRPLKSRPDAVLMCYQTALDCWHQADRRGCLQGRQVVVNAWNGRPERPGRTKE